MKKFFKSFLLIGFMFLSYGIFAQSTSIYLQTIPQKPASAPDIGTATAVWTLDDGSTITNYRNFDPVNQGMSESVFFTGTPEEAIRVVNTHVSVILYGGAAGISGNFPGFPAIVYWDNTLSTTHWWIITPPPQRGGSYTYTMTTVEP